MGGIPKRNHVDPSSLLCESTTAGPKTFKKIPTMSSNPLFSRSDTPSILSRTGSRYAEEPGKSRKRAGLTRNLRMRTSDWVHEFINVKDGDKGVVKKIEFLERRYLRRIYDTPARKILLMTSRQTEKSTTIANRMIAGSAMQPMYTSLFVTPSAMQTKVFSTARIDDIIDISPLVKSLTHKALTYNLLEKEIVNKSKLYLRYAFLSADRIRGLSNNAVFIDEIQDILQDVLPVILETASHYRNPLYMYSGTPKTLDNTIEHLWSRQSTQTEWAIPCEHHGTPSDPSSWHWVVLGLKNLGKTGPICERCGSYLNPEHPKAQWVITGNPKAEYEGYRICRLMVPWFWKPDHNSPNPYSQWQSILHAHQNYPTAQFMNEVLALGHDSGTKPITRIELVRACDDHYLMDESQIVELSKSHELFGGIDWGTGENCYTVFSIGGYVRPDANFQVLMSKRFSGQLADPIPQMREIFRLIDLFRLKFIGTDYGMGFHPNKILTSKYGAKRIHQFQYAARSSTKVLFRAAMMRYILYRSPLMADIFMAIKTLKIRLPAFSVYNYPYIADIEAIYAEYSETLKMIMYNKPRNKPDDTFHSILYLMLASFLQFPRPDIMAPLQEPTQSDEAAWRVTEDALIEDLEADIYSHPGTDPYEGLY